MATGDLGDLGPPAPKHVEEECSHAVATVTTHGQSMGNSVLEAVQPAKLAIHSAVRLLIFTNIFITNIYLLGPVNAKWNGWGSWSSCTRGLWACGTGARTRTRSCSKGNCGGVTDCSGSSSEKGTCFMGRHCKIFLL